MAAAMPLAPLGSLQLKLITQAGEPASLGVMSVDPSAVWGS